MAQSKKKPRTKDLRKIYSKLLSPSLGTRLAVLSTALQWWDGAKTYFESRPRFEWTTEQMKLIVLLEKTRRLGIDNDALHEKESALRKTIELYEQLRPRFRAPKVSVFYGVYEQRRQRLEGHQGRLMSRYGNIIKLLSEALLPRNHSGKAIEIVATDASSLLDPVLCQKMYSRSDLERYKKQLRAEGPLALLLTAAEGLSRAAALLPDGNGGFTYDSKLHVEAIWTMQHSLVAFLRQSTAPKKLIRTIVATGAPKSSPKRVHTGGGFGKTRDRSQWVAGRYIPGGRTACLYESLVSQEALPKMGQDKGSIKKLREDGILHGGWKIVETPDAIQMILNS